MLSARPLNYTIGQLLGFPSRNLDHIASDRWEIAPAETLCIAPVIILPGQAERITRAEFASLPHLIASLQGDPAGHLGPTRGYRLTDVDIIDGVLYSHGLTIHLRQRRHRMPLGRLDDCGRASIYETWTGNRWFGNWLTDDCLTYRLAEETGAPATTAPLKGGHVPRYETLLGLAPRHLGNSHFDELILFDDHPNNSHRQSRAQAMRDRLLRQTPAGEVRPVFLMRGRTGDLRLLENEIQIAGRLEQDFGFRIMQAEAHSVDELVSACSHAPIVAGVEGSQLNHGVVAMPPGATLLTLQPPDRAATAMKLLTDRWQQYFAMVIGRGTAGSFRIDPEEIVRTIDLIHRKTAKEFPLPKS